MNTNWEKKNILAHPRIDGRLVPRAGTAGSNWPAGYSVQMNP